MAREGRRSRGLSRRRRRSPLCLTCSISTNPRRRRATSCLRSRIGSIFSRGGGSSETRENGDFLDPTLPPIELPHRLCVESRITFHRPMRVGDPISRLSRVSSTSPSAQGASGRSSRFCCAMKSRTAMASRSPKSDALYIWRVESASESGRASAGAGRRRIWRRQFHADHARAFSVFRADARHEPHSLRSPFRDLRRGPSRALSCSGDLVAALLFDLLREHAPGRRVRSCEIWIHRWLYDTGPMRLFGASARNEARPTYGRKTRRAASPSRRW